MQNIPLSDKMFIRIIFRICFFLFLVPVEFQFQPDGIIVSTKKASVVRVGIGYLFFHNAKHLET